MVAAVSAATDTSRIQAVSKVPDSGTVERDRVIQTNAAGHPVAELPSVLDVVDTGDGVFAAEQERGVVARITIPGRRIGRRRLTEGEAGELQEHIFDRDIAFADIA